jgi:hypothetical protein
MNIMFPVQIPDIPTDSQGTPPNPQSFQRRPEQTQIEQRISLPEIVTNPSRLIENFANPILSGRTVGFRQLGSLQRRKRALPTAEMAREVFKLRGRLAASERESGNYSSLFTARSMQVSQVAYHVANKLVHKNLTHTLIMLPEFRA